jgi:hypothetical protein
MNEPAAFIFSSELKMEAVSSFEMVITTYGTLQCLDQEDQEP